jgi:hypothetical protein
MRTVSGVVVALSLLFLSTAWAGEPGNKLPGEARAILDKAADIELFTPETPASS